MAKKGFVGRAIPVGHTKHGGGLNSTAGPLGLEDNESPDLQNVDFDKFGSVATRNGYAALNTSPVTGTTTIDGLHWFQTTTLRKPVMMTGTAAYRMDLSNNEPDGTWDAITGTTTITAGNHFDYDTFLSNVLATNDQDVPIIYTGAGNFIPMTVPSNLTRAKFVTHFQNYTLLANVVVNTVDLPSRWYFSTIRTLDTWADADFIEISKDDGEEITGFRVLGDRLVVYKVSSIHIVTFTGDSTVPFIVQKSNSHVGCVAPYSIQDVDNGHVFLAYDGVYFFDGNNSYKMSDRVTTTFETFTKTQLASAVSMYQKSKNKYWLALTTSTDNNRVLTWDAFNNAWSVYVGLDPAAMAIFTIAGVEERPYFGDYKGRVFRADTGTNDFPLNVSTPIDAFFWTNWKTYDDLADQNAVPLAYIYHKDQTGTLTFAYAYDFNTTDQFSNTFTTTSGSGFNHVITPQHLDGRGRVVRFKFAMNRASEQFQIDGIGVKAHLETDI